MKQTTTRESEMSRQSEIEYRLDEIEELEDCGIERSAKVQREYERLMAEWNSLEEEAKNEA
jgi:uncharacterized protein YydD (DUF2326 family)